MVPSRLSLYRAPGVAGGERPDAERCIAALVAAHGNAKLAAERLGLEDEIELQLIIADDPNNIEILTQQIRTHTILSTFELLGKSLILMSASLGELEPYDLSKHTNNLIQLMERLTEERHGDVNINVNDVLLKSLPTEVREAVRGFIEHDSTNA